MKRFSIFIALAYLSSIGLLSAVGDKPQRDLDKEITGIVQGLKDKNSQNQKLITTLDSINRENVKKNYQALYDGGVVSSTQRTFLEGYGDGQDEGGLRILLSNPVYYEKVRQAANRMDGLVEDELKKDQNTEKAENMIALQLLKPDILKKQEVRPGDDIKNPCSIQ